MEVRVGRVGRRRGCSPPRRWWSVESDPIGTVLLPKIASPNRSVGTWI